MVVATGLVHHSNEVILASSIGFPGTTSRLIYATAVGIWSRKVQEEIPIPTGHFPPKHEREKEFKSADDLRNHLNFDGGGRRRLNSIEGTIVAIQDNEAVAMLLFAHIEDYDSSM